LLFEVEHLLPDCFCRIDLLEYFCQRLIVFIAASLVGALPALDTRDFVFAISDV